MPRLITEKDVAFTDAFSEYYAVVYGTLYSRVGDPDTAEDLAQEVFIRFYNKMEDAVNMRAWLLVTAKYVLYEYYRKVKNQPDELARDEAFGDVSLTFVNGFRDARIVIDQAITEIDDADRSLFDLVAVQNYTYEEAGSLLGMSRRQVKYRYGLIVRRVLDYLRRHGIHELEDLL